MQRRDKLAISNTSGLLHNLLQQPKAKSNQHAMFDVYVIHENAARKQHRTDILNKFKIYAHFAATKLRNSTVAKVTDATAQEPAATLIYLPTPLATGHASAGNKECTASNKRHAARGLFERSSSTTHNTTHTHIHTYTHIHTHIAVSTTRQCKLSNEVTFSAADNGNSLLKRIGPKW